MVEEIGVLGENQRTAANHWNTVSHNVVSGFDPTTLDGLSEQGIKFINLN